MHTHTGAEAVFLFGSWVGSQGKGRRGVKDSRSKAACGENGMSWPVYNSSVGLLRLSCSETPKCPSHVHVFYTHTHTHCLRTDNVLVLVIHAGGKINPELN